MKPWPWLPALRGLSGGQRLAIVGGQLVVVVHAGAVRPLDVPQIAAATVGRNMQPCDHTT
jgi:hypothetical protein